MDFKSIGSSLTKQSHSKAGLNEPLENQAKEGKNSRTSAKKADKVSLSSKGVEQSAKALKLVAQLQKMTQADPVTATLALASLNLEKAAALLQ